jgi:tungstate transport system substrate-binding protein
MRIGKCIASLVASFALVCGFSISAAAAEAAGEVVLATTTSVRDSGLLDVLLPPFQKQTQIEVKVIAVGSGAALRMARDGNADLVLAHAPEPEEALVKEGFALDRRALAENFFVIAGPPEDPARVREAKSAADAIARIFAAGAPFASRGDDSGTHQRERALLTAAGLPPEATGPSVLRTGSGMGPTLQVAGEKRAYVLTDEGAFRALRARIGLVALSGRDPALRNVYSVLRVAPGKFAPGRIRAENATLLADHLLSAASREAIAGFGATPDEGPLFVPLAAAPAP